MHPLVVHLAVIFGNLINSETENETIEPTTNNTIQQTVETISVIQLSKSENPFINSILLEFSIPNRNSMEKFF